MHFLLRKLATSASQRIFSRLPRRLFSTALEPLCKLDEELHNLSVSTGLTNTTLSDADINNLEKLKESLYNEIRKPKEVRSLKVIQELKERIERQHPISLHSINILLRASTYLNDVAEMKRLLLVMRDNNIKFNSITYLILANYYQSCRYPYEAERVVKDAESKGFCFDHRFATVLVRAFSRVSLKKAEDYFREAVLKEGQYCKPDVWLYNAMICGYIDNGRVEKAEEVMEQMNAKGLYADNVTLKIMIIGHLKVGNLERARSLWDSVTDRLDPSMKIDDKAEICAAFWNIRDAEYGKKILQQINFIKSARTHALICEVLNEAAKMGDMELFTQQYEKHILKNKDRYSRMLFNILHHVNTTPEIKQFLSKELQRSNIE